MTTADRRFEAAKAAMNPRLEIASRILCEIVAKAPRMTSENQPDAALVMAEIERRVHGAVAHADFLLRELARTAPQAEAPTSGSETPAPPTLSQTPPAKDLAAVMANDFADLPYVTAYHIRPHLAGMVPESVVRGLEVASERIISISPQSTYSWEITSSIAKQALAALAEWRKGAKV